VSFARKWVLIMILLAGAESRILSMSSAAISAPNPEGPGGEAGLPSEKS
jgi:hypothetical protein